MLLLALVGAVYFAAIKIGPRYGFFTDNEAEAAEEKFGPGERRLIAAHGCSLQLPDGWVQRQEQRDAVLFEFPRGAKDRGSMIVDSEAFPGTLREFVEGHLKNMVAANPELQIVSDGPFATDAGIPAFKITMRNRIGTVYLAQGMYLFEGPPGRKIKVTYAASVAGEDLEPIFDACLKTLLLHTGPEPVNGGKGTTAK
ncbi:MAG: hypothetical protein ACAH88_13405 [Roseimicrobium sp.]